MSSSYSTSNSSDYSEESDSLKYNPGGEILNDKYLLISELGSGTFSTVWLAYNINNKKYCAVKIQDSNEIETGLEESKLLNRFKNERCPYINKLIESFHHRTEYGEHICMVSDLMAGSLYDITESGKYSNGFPLFVVPSIVPPRWVIPRTVLGLRGMSPSSSGISMSPT